MQLPLAIEDGLGGNIMSVMSLQQITMHSLILNDKSMCTEMAFSTKHPVMPTMLCWEHYQNNINNISIKSGCDDLIAPNILTLSLSAGLSHQQILRSWAQQLSLISVLNWFTDSCKIS